MVTVPGFLLRRLYIKGSLHNTPKGVEFQLRNTLGSGYARKLFPLAVDGKPVPLEQSFFHIDGNAIPFGGVSEEQPFTLAMNRSITVQLQGLTLPPGPHKVAMSFLVQGFGNLSFEFTDVVSQG
ncbi:MAG: hypothetical protein HY686_04555 [Chloroflexi bacterium]|nr:hypothetical protein [Chloroflexota bacterium]